MRDVRLHLLCSPHVVGQAEAESSGGREKRRGLASWAVKRNKCQRSEKSPRRPWFTCGRGLDQSLRSSEGAGDSGVGWGVRSNSDQSPVKVTVGSSAVCSLSCVPVSSAQPSRFSRSVLNRLPAAGQTAIIGRGLRRAGGRSTAMLGWWEPSDGANDRESSSKIRCTELSFNLNDLHGDDTCLPQSPHSSWCPCGKVALPFCLTLLLLRSTLLLLWLWRCWSERIQPSQYSVQFNDDGSSAGFLLVPLERSGGLTPWSSSVYCLDPTEWNTLHWV